MIFSKLKSDNYFIALILFSFSYFFIILFSGFFSDDAYSSQIIGILNQSNQSLLEHTIKTIFGWLIGSGRNLVFSQYQFIIFYLIENLIIYKFFVLFLIISVFCIFYLLNIKIFKSSEISFIVTVFSILSLQLREFHDPILGFHALIPLMAFLYFLQIFLLIKYFENKQKNILLISVFLFFILSFMYELSFVFIFFNFFILKFFINQNHEIIKILKYHIYIFFFSIFIFLVLQTRVQFFSTNQAPDYLIFNKKFELLITIKAFLYQLSSNFPSTYFFAKYSEYNFNNEFIKYFIVIITLFLIAIFFCLKKKLFLKNILNIKHQDNKTLIGIFLSFILLPSSFILLSSHSKEVYNMGFGYGYIFNFFSSFSIGYAAILILNHFNKINKIFVFLLIIIFFIINSISNIQTVLNSNKIYKFPNRLISKAVNKGILSDLYDDDIIIKQKRYASDSSWNYSAKSNINLIILNPNEVLYNLKYKKIKKSFNKNNSGFISYDAKEDRIFTIHYFFNDQGLATGNFFLGKVNEFIEFDKKIISINVTNLKIYEENRNRLIEINLDESINFLKLIYDNDQNPKKYFEEINLKKYNIYK